MTDPLHYNAPTAAERRPAIARKVRRWLLRVVLTLVALAAIGFAIDQIWVWHWRRITIGHDTTRILSPIDKDGRPDYLGVINAQLAAGVTPENNAGPLLLEITGTDEHPKLWQAAVHRELGLPPEPFPHAFMSLAEVRHRASGGKGKVSGDAEYAGSDEETMAASAPWNSAEHPDWRAWIEANGKALMLLHALAACDRNFVPLATKDGKTAALGEEKFIDIMLPRLGYLRRISQLALARAMMRLHEGDVAGFRSDVLASAKLARLQAQGPMLIEYLTALAVESEVFTTVQAAAGSALLSNADIAHLAGELNALPPFPPPILQLDWFERYCWLEIYCKFARLNDLSGDFPTFRTVPVNFNRCLRIANVHFDGQVAALGQPTFTARRDALSLVARSSDAAAARSPRIESLLLNLAFFSVSGANNYYTAALANRQLAMTALALRVHHNRTGTFPATLVELSKDTPVTDPFTDAPLAYKRTPSGYLLYSLGPNQADDGAIPRAAVSHGSIAYDIILEVPAKR